MSKKKLIAIIGLIAAVAIIFWRKIALLGLVIILFVGTLIARPEITTDVSKYAELRSGPTAKENYQHRWGMDESIWPEVITENMEVKDYKMVYYEPWDAQYLGHLVVKYPDSEYKAEVERLKAYKSTEYKGYYDVTGESDYELLAINADPYYGFIYAMTDDKNTIIYAEQVFCNYFMDLKYEKYMPKEYFLDGFDATTNSQYYKEKEREMDEIANEQKSMILDTLMDTLDEGRHSFLDFSTFPDLLKSSNPSLSAKQEPFDERLFFVVK